MKVVIAGTGYVGLVSGACLAEIGHTVICIDRDATRIADISAGRMPIYEPGLEEMVLRNVETGRLRFEAGFQPFSADVDMVFIAVGTPPSKNDQSADLSAVFEVAEQIAQNATRSIAIVTKSTVPVGTGDRIARVVKRCRPELAFSVVSNPEFLREGSAIVDFMRPDRVIIGSETTKGHELLAELYRPLSDRGAVVVHTARRSAEIIKYAANAFLATKIAFINEIADLCEVTGAEINDVSDGIGLDRRIGKEFLRCGPGYGGSCFPKDTEALLATAQGHGIQLRLVESTIVANEVRKRSMVRRVAAALGGDAAGLTVGILGLTFKADTDDMRQAPSLTLIASLIQSGAIVKVYDPEGMDAAKGLIDGALFCEDAYACVDAADAVVVMTDWSEFTTLDFAKVEQTMNGNTVIDLRNCLVPESVRASGLKLFRLGEGTLASRQAPAPDAHSSDARFRHGDSLRPTFA